MNSKITLAQSIQNLFRLTHQGNRATFDWALVVLLAVFLLSALVLFAPSIRGNDGVCNYVFLRSLYFDGDVDFTNEYRAFDSLKQYPYRFSDKPLNPRTGLPENRYGIGSAMLWSPFFLVGHYLTEALAPQEADGYSRAYAVAISLGSLFYGTLGLLLLYGILRRVVHSCAAALAVLAVWGASPLTFYLYFHPSMSHANSFFLVVLFLWLYLHLLRQPSPSRAAVMGIVGGLMAVTRFQDGVYLLLPIFGFVFARLLPRKKVSPETEAPASGQRWWLLAVNFLLAAWLAMTPQFIVWSLLQGSPLSGPTPYLGYSDFNLLWPRHLLQTFFASNHGLFFWHPLWLAGLVGLLWGGNLIRSRAAGRDATEFGRQRRLFVAMFLLQAYLVSCWSVWWGGASFGARLYISTLLALAFGLAALVNRLITSNGGETAGAQCRRKPLTIAAGIVAIFVVWNFGLIVQYGLGLIPREGPVSPATLVRRQFTEVPSRAFGAAGRFLGDRSGFAESQPVDRREPSASDSTTTGSVNMRPD
ncbi:MAG: hypothetical protein V2A74_13880 [bacterium]